MNHNRESIFSSGIRSFVVSIFAMLGIILGLLVFLILINGLGSLSEGEPELENKQVILPDADGKRKLLPASDPVILQLDIHGIIGSEKLNATHIRTKLLESREGKLKDDRVKALLIHINTPGGTVFDADDIYHALMEYKEQHKVPIYMFVDGLCASGGMYIAAAADKIYASNSSLVGSVGVLIPTFVNVSQSLDKIGVQTVSITAGKGKDAMNPLRPWKPGEDDNYRFITDYYYQYFVNLIVSSRPRIEKEKLINDYGAKIFPASQAQEIGFIDEAGKNRQSALRDLAIAAGLEGKKYQVVGLESKNWLSELLKAESPLFNGIIKHRIQLGSELDSDFAGKALYLYHPE